MARLLLTRQTCLGQKPNKMEKEGELSEAEIAEQIADELLADQF